MNKCIREGTPIDDNSFDCDYTLIAYWKLVKSIKEDALYKNPELTVGDLANHLGVKPYLVTKALSTSMQTKFTDYINEHRFQELQRLLSQPDNNKYTLLSLAFEAGFNSKASFNRTVKKITGTSPKFLRPE